MAYESIAGIISPMVTPFDAEGRIDEQAFRAEARYLVIIDKIAATPPDYPRRSGVPARRPLR